MGGIFPSTVPPGKVLVRARSSFLDMCEPGEEKKREVCMFRSYEAVFSERKFSCSVYHWRLFDAVEEGSIRETKAD